MSGEEAEEPKGLYLSLDALIEENRDSRRGRGRGPRGGGRGQQGRFDGGAARREQFYAQRGRGRGQGGNFGDRQGYEQGGVVCFKCGEPGHKANECPGTAGGGGGSGAPLGPCFNCGQMGHRQRDCPLPAGGGGGMQQQPGAAMGAGMRPQMGMGMGAPMGMGGPGPMGMAGPMAGPMGPMGMPGPMGMLPPAVQLEQLRMQQMLLQQAEMALLSQQGIQQPGGGGLGAQQQQQQGGSGGPMRRQQQQQQQQQQSRSEQYRRDQRCFVDNDTGDVVVQYKATEIVRVAPSGDITLNTDGWFNPTTLASMNDALNVLGIRVTAPTGDVRGGEWSITDGRGLIRYFDGVVVPSKGTQHASRGQQLLQAFQNPHRAAAAAATAASNAAAAQAGIVPSMGYGSGGGGGGGTGRGHGRGGVFNRLGGRVQQNRGEAGGMDMDEDEESARVRRLKAKGRYNPY